MAQECTPEVNSRQMKFLTALHEKGHLHDMQMAMQLANNAGRVARQWNRACS